VTESLAWSNRSAASTASDVLALSIPAAFATYDWFTVQDKTSVARDLLVVTEAAALTGLVTQVAKFTAARQRPYAYYGAPTGAADDRLSFWSGHAALTFTVAAASGTVARLDGDPAWPWIYAIGFTAAAGTSYLRLAAEKHWLSDVLVGAAVGTAVGFTVPLLHRKTGDLPVRVGAMPGGVLVFGTF
jgi:membrane-associated phospholipid phosphatase